MTVLKWGMSQAASDAYKASGHDPARLGQTIGNAVLSAGTHEQDGTDQFGNPYSAAVDISVMHPTKLTDDEIRSFSRDLSAHLFACFPRLPWHPEDGWLEIAHMHCIYVNEPMKLPLRNQVHSLLRGHNGLKGDGVYHFIQQTPEILQKLREAFLAHNPETG